MTAWPGEVGDSDEGGSGEDHATAGQSVESVRQVDSVGASHEDQHRPGGESDSEGQSVVAERPDKVEATRFGHLFRVQPHAGDQCQADLGGEFLFNRQSASGGSQLDPVIRGAEGTEGDGDEQSDLDVGVGQVAPQEDGGDDGGDDEQSAHRRCLLFVCVQFVESL